MAWELEIHMIDVGQGESCLIRVTDTAMVAPNPPITMLIDGGESSRGEIVNAYIAGLGIAQVDHIVVSHYDADHKNGIEALLSADNLYQTVTTIATSAVAAAAIAAANGADIPHQIAASAAAATAVMGGGYDDNGAGNYANVAVNAGTLAEALDLSGAHNNSQYADEGSDAGYDAITAAGHNLNPNLFNLAMGLRRRSWRAAGINYANVAACIPALLAIMYSGVNPLARFSTEGRYRDTHIIDIGTTADTPANWTDLAIDGEVINNNLSINAPNLGRTRTSVAPGDNGDEMLWNSGPNAMAAPAGSPAMFLVANNKYIWQAPGGTCPIASGQASNDDSIGFVIRFNRFFYYTAGDLPSQGDILVANAVTGNGFINPQGGGNFAAAMRIAAFKCGHHGSNNSTSQAFLTAVNPTAALISCGTNPHGHPEQNLINRLFGQASIEFFYMTNCNLLTNHIPASNGQNQLTAVGNKSRIAGDNYHDNIAAGRDRGNIVLTINTPHSNSAVAINRFFNITYYDEDTPALGGGPVGGGRTESTLF